MSHPQPVLAWRRSDANRRDTLLLLVLFAIVLLPAALFLAHYLTEIIALFLLFTTSADLPSTSPLRTLAISGFVAVLILVAVGMLEFRYAARLVLRITGAAPVTRDEQPELWRLVENLCIGAGLPVPAVCRIDSAAANAYSTGLRPDAASLVVTRALLELLDRRELEGVLAQEIVQIGNQDTRLKTVVAALVATLWLPVWLVARAFRFLFRLHWLVGAGCLLWIGLPLVFGTIASLPWWIDLVTQEMRADPVRGMLVLAVLSLPVYAMFIAPLAGVAIRAALSRKRELAADADAVLLTRNPGALMRALIKIRDAETVLPTHPATAHLFLVDPRAGGGRSAVLRTHPPLERRIELLSAMGGRFSEPTADDPPR